MRSKIGKKKKTLQNLQNRPWSQILRKYYSQLINKFESNNEMNKCLKK